jgi:hypothetical protein
VLCDSSGPPFLASRRSFRNHVHRAASRNQPGFTASRRPLANSRIIRRGVA